MPLNLTPTGPPFSGDDIHQYLPLDVKNGPLPLDASANQGHRQLFRLIKEYAPHLRESFVNSETWWDRNWGTPEAHVRPSNQEFFFVDYVLTVLQMFKYLLYRGMEDILIIFNHSRAVRAEEIRADLLEANQKAELVWKDRTKTLSTRRAECIAILDPVLRRNLSAESGEFFPVPLQVASGLDQIFAKHYKPDSYLLIGKTDENAYTVQDLYADEVGILLGKVRRSYRSRAITRLGKAYGRSSIPLLSMASVSALWQICQSDYYKGQLLLVGSSCSRVGRRVTDSQSSCTGGSNRLQSRWGRGRLDAVTFRP